MSYELVLELDRDTPDYAHGFAMGQLWEQLKAKPKIHEGVYNVDCTEQIRLIARRLGYGFSRELLEDEGGPTDWARFLLGRLE